MNKWDNNIKQISQIIAGEVPDNLVNGEVLERPEFKIKMEKFLA